MCVEITKFIFLSKYIYNFKKTKFLMDIDKNYLTSQYTIYAILIHMIISTVQKMYFWELTTYSLFSFFAPFFPLFNKITGASFFLKKLIFLITKNPNREKKFKHKYKKLLLYDIRSIKLTIKEKDLNNKTLQYFFNNVFMILYYIVLVVVTFINIITMFVIEKKSLCIYIFSPVFMILFLFLVYTFIKYRQNTITLILIYNFLININNEMEIPILEKEESDTLLLDIEEHNIIRVINNFENLTKQ